MLESYRMVKDVKAEPMTLGEYCEFREFSMPRSLVSNDKGYRVVYSDGFQEWMFKKHFEDEYASL